jgi:hypothetical protein
MWIFFLLSILAISVVFIRRFSLFPGTTGFAIGAYPLSYSLGSLG